jgi:hypothetical protein
VLNQRDILSLSNDGWHLAIVKQEQCGIMLSQSGKSSESTNVRVSLIICIAGLIVFAVYVVIHFLLPLD